jgi:hypothetical protein
MEKLNSILKVEKTRRDGLREENAIDITKQFLRKFSDVVEKAKIFLSDMKIENIDLSMLKVYKIDDMVYGAAATQFDGTILLFGNFFEGSLEEQKTWFLHELIHYMSRKKSVIVNEKIHEHSGYGLQHITAKNTNANTIEVGGDFLVGFNEGVTEWITFLIMGNNNVEYLPSIKLIRYLVNRVSNQLSSDEIVRDYFNNGTKFLRVIKNIYGKGSIKILNMLSIAGTDEMDNNIYEFFTTKNDDERNNLREMILERAGQNNRK